MTVTRRLAVPLLLLLAIITAVSCVREVALTEAHGISDAPVTQVDADVDAALSDDGGVIDAPGPDADTSFDAAVDAS